MAVLQVTEWRVDRGVGIRDVVKYVRRRGKPRTHGMVYPLCPQGRKGQDPLRTGFTKECYARCVPTSIAIASREKRDSAFPCSIRFLV